MSKIVQAGNWRSSPHLDGVALEHGEALRIEWLDGSSSVERVSVLEDADSMHGRGLGNRDDEIYRSSAWVRISYRGVVAAVPIVGLEASRV